ncbi:MAG: hypothetical protein J6D54_08355 [Olsenella sp.]|nr:hypothetical protein [Olsenella sp.]
MTVRELIDRLSKLDGDALVQCGADQINYATDIQQIIQVTDGRSAVVLLMEESVIDL